MESSNKAIVYICSPSIIKRSEQLVKRGLLEINSLALSTKLEIKYDIETRYKRLLNADKYCKSGDIKQALNEYYEILKIAEDVEIRRLIISLHSLLSEIDLVKLNYTKIIDNLVRQSGATDEVWIEGDPTSLALVFMRKLFEIDDSYKSVYSEIKLKLEKDSVYNGIVFELIENREEIDFDKNKDKIILSLRETGNDINYSGFLQSKNTLLHISVDSNDFDAVKLFVKMGADINIKNQKGETPLDLAKNSGNKEITDYLKSLS